MKQSGLVAALDRIFEFFSSLRLAVFTLIGLIGAMATATVLESMYDTKTAQFYVYRAWWFFALLGLLGVNIFFVAVSRYPWKPKHIPFLLAHLGILILLAGSFVTWRYGLDASLRVSEGETASLVETDQMALVLSEKERAYSFPVRWLPPDVEFKPMTLKADGIPYDLRVDRFISRADPVYEFVPAPAAGKLGFERPALQLRLEGGPMRITQDFWLWSGDKSFQSLQAGPSKLEIVPPAELKAAKAERAGGKPLLLVARQAKPAGLLYKAFSSSGKISQGFLADAHVEGAEIKPDWKTVKLTFKKWVPDAVPQTTYVPSKFPFGQQAPPSAIHVIVGKGGEGSEIWLGLGDRATLSFDGRTVDVGFFPQRLVLPFSVRLERFNIERYEGTINPASYESRVSIVGGPAPIEATISMNEPLHHQGVTLYQASYEDAKPRPTTSIFSVNRDPGREMKYWGSLLIVLGSILLFLDKYGAWRRLKQRFSRGGKTA